MSSMASGITRSNHDCSEAIIYSQALSREHMGEIKAVQYDLALNGYEVAGGSIRTHDPEILHKVFELLGHSHE